MIRHSAEPQHVIAKMFDVAQSNVSYIKTRATWRHL